MSISVHFINYAQLASLGEKKNTVQLRSEKSNFIEIEKINQNENQEIEKIEKIENTIKNQNYINEHYIVNTEGLGFY